MSKRDEVFSRDYTSEKTKDHEGILIELFTKILERDLFSNCTIRVVESNRDSVVFIADINCNFCLADGLFQFNSITSDRDNIATKYDNSPIYQAVKSVNENLMFSTDFKEISINFEDVSIIIGRIYPLSILEQLEVIFKRLSYHFAHFTKGFTEMPYEIYLPVYEDDLPNQTGKKVGRNKFDYFKYWGLYFNSDSNMKVYDCRTQLLVDGDFFLIE